MSDMSLPAVPTRWKVVAQTPKLVPTPTGQYVQGYQITAQIIASNTTFSITVPASQYNLANVQQLLEQAYEQFGGVDGLSG